MSKPKEFVRRVGLVEWLGGKGFSASQVDAMIAAKVIPQRHFDHPRRRKKGEAQRRGSRSKASKKQHPKPGRAKAAPELIKGRAWYHTPTVAAALRIDL